MVLITFNTMLIPGVNFIGLDRFLFDRKYSGLTNALVLSLFVTGILIGFYSKGDRFTMGVAIAFLSPSYHLFLYKQLRNLFARVFKREPRDVAFNFKTGLAIDRVFAIFLDLFSIFSSMAIVGLFIWNSD